MEDSAEDSNTAPPVRIARYLADCGVASRRKSEGLIRQGRIGVNGEIIADLGRRIAPGSDTITLDGKPIAAPVRHVTLAFHKPARIVVSRGDPQGRTTVYDMLPARYQALAGRLRYAGRLDFLTSGLLLLSTDGDLINRLVHPRHHVAKAYEVETAAPLDGESIGLIRRGIPLEDGPALPATVERLSPFGRGSNRYRIVLREGRNRQVRRMIEAVGGRVVHLHRSAIGRLTLAELDLVKGEFRPLTPEHLRALREEPVIAHG